MSRFSPSFDKTNGQYLPPKTRLTHIAFCLAAPIRPQTSRTQPNISWPKENPLNRPRRAASGSLAAPLSQDFGPKSIELDKQIVKLLNERAEHAAALCDVKRDAGDDIYDVVRERNVLSKVISLNKGPLSNQAMRGVFRELISGTRALETRLQVGYLGPEYSYSHLATLERFGTSAELVPIGSISAVFEEVNRCQIEYGVVPIENSTDGRIADTLEMFTRLPLRICGEVEMAIHHNLLGLCQRSDVKEVYSKPQALSQCRNWLSQHLPSARTIEVTSTSTAAQLASERPGVAAIASRQAGIHHGLDILASNIEDNRANLTRFAIIGQTTGVRTGDDKTAIMFGVAHRPGGLADSMAIFKRNRLNLTWIESFPIPGPEDGYLFFIELEGHESDTRVRRAITSLEKKATRLEILGSYAKAEPLA